LFWLLTSGLKELFLSPRDDHTATGQTRFILKMLLLAVIIIER
jgi:hypothetical protein